MHECNNPYRILNIEILHLIDPFSNMTDMTNGQIGCYITETFLSQDLGASNS